MSRGVTGISETALQALRLVVQHVAEDLYPDTYVAAEPGAMLEPIRRNDAGVRDGFVELWHVAGFEGTPGAETVI